MTDELCLMSCACDSPFILFQADLQNASDAIATINILVSE
jgi:hypothetical protein